jgi:putative nucleotidyltransferase with HDIG domain
LGATSSPSSYPATGPSGAFTFVQRLQAALVGQTAQIPIRAASGIAEAIERIPKETLVRRADLALLEAKRSHRGALIYSADLEARVALPDQAVQQHHRKTLASALARAVDAKDSYTRSHCETVSELCVRIAEDLGFEPERIQKIRLAGLLHDVGKIGISDAILQKPSKLSEEEFAVMKTHPTLGAEIVLAAEMEEEARWIRHHHERLDGGGYPDGLRADAIPIESRIILVADAFEAITSDRPYRSGQSEDVAFAELEKHAGTQFDPACVAALKEALVQGKNASDAVADLISA